MAWSRQKRILTGIRPTGSLHLGHYAGALKQWVRLQEEYECFFLIADYQVSDYVDDIDHVRRSVWEVALDWLAVGLDPERGHFVIESQVPQHAELTVLLSLVPAAGAAAAESDAEVARWRRWSRRRRACRSASSSTR